MIAFAKPLEFMSSAPRPSMAQKEHMRLTTFMKLCPPLRNLGWRRRSRRRCVALSKACVVVVVIHCRFCVFLGRFSICDDRVFVRDRCFVTEILWIILDYEFVRFHSTSFTYR
jgi:hypothetical protein